VNTKRKKLFSLGVKALSGFIAMLLLFITVVQALHQHGSTTNYDNGSESREYVDSTNKCVVCDYLSHHHNKEFHLPAPVLVTAPVIKPVTLHCRSYAGIYKFTLQGFTNKGPPICRVTILT
jgi:hypothetical protein